MDDDRILELNRQYLKDIFFKKICDRDTKVIDKSQFLKFIANLEIFPNLIKAEDLKKIMSVIIRNKNGDKVKDISYIKFESLIKAIANHSFHSSDSIRLLITHVKSMCFLHYQTNLVTKMKNQLNLLRTNRMLNSNKAQLDIPTLAKSISQKMSFSGLPSSRNQANSSLKISEYSSPSLKIPRNKHLTESLSSYLNLPDPNTKMKKLEKISEIAKKFQSNFSSVLARRSCRANQLVLLVRKISLKPNSVS